MRLAAFKDLLFPPSCAACGALGAEPFCGLCEAALESAPALSSMFARYLYGGPIALAIYKLKYEDRPELGRVLGANMCSLLPRLQPFDVAVPVPLSLKSLRARGYNQSRELLRGLGLEGDNRALTRAEGPKQVGQGRAARMAWLGGAFSADRRRVQEKRILVVDDVITTGATVSACRQALLGAGARSVQVLALAHSEKDQVYP